MKRFSRALDAFFWQLIWIGALGLLVAEGWTLWRWGALDFVYQTLVHDGIPDSSRDSIGQGMFTELAGWLISILAPLVAAVVVRGQTKREIQTEQTLRSGGFVWTKHFGFIYSLHERVLYAAKRALQQNPQSLARLKVDEYEVASHPASRTSDQLREGVDQHLLLATVRKEIEQAADEYREALNLVFPYEDFLRRLGETDGGGGKNKFLAIYDQHHETGRTFETIVATLNRCALVISEDAGYFPRRNEKRILERVSDAIANNWSIVLENSYLSYDSPSIEGEPALSAANRSPTFHDRSRL